MNSQTIVKVFATTGSVVLGAEVEKEIRKRISSRKSDYQVNHGGHTVSIFSNENIEVQIDNVRDQIALVIHTQNSPVNEGVMELFAMLDAINNAHPRRTFVVFPYMPYSRSDRKNKPRISVMGQRLPEILNKVMRVQRVMLLEPHNGHITSLQLPTKSRSFPSSFAIFERSS
jgi:phosphoribosylpyrophosphate synthetase